VGNRVSLPILLELSGVALHNYEHAWEERKVLEFLNNEGKWEERINSCAND
jgi:hypothetical protein